MFLCCGCMADTVAKYYYIKGMSIHYMATLANTILQGRDGTRRV